MTTIKLLLAFVTLAALARAESTATSDRVIQLPPVVVEATRLPNLIIDVRPSLDEVRAQANLAVRIDMRRTVDRSIRRLAANPRRLPAAVILTVEKPKV